MKEKRHVVSTKDHNLLKETEVVRSTLESKLESQKAYEKKDGEPWYFTHS